MTTSNPKDRLLAAIDLNDEGELNSLLSQGLITAQDIVQHDGPLRSPLHAACFAGRAILLGRILSAVKGVTYASPTASNGYTALHAAAMNGHTACLEQLESASQSEWEIARDAKCKMEGCTPLMLAIREGHLKAAEFLIELNADLLVKDNNGDNAFMYACRHNHCSLLGPMKDMRPSIRNQKNDRGVAPIHEAIKSGAVPLVQQLLELNVDVNMLGPSSTGEEQHPVELVISNDAFTPDEGRGLIERLIGSVPAGKHPLKQELKEGTGITVLHRVSEKEELAHWIPILVKFGADVNAPAKHLLAKKCTPLFFAAKKKAIKCLTELARANADLTFKCEVERGRVKAPTAGEFCRDSEIQSLLEKWIKGGAPKSESEKPLPYDKQDILVKLFDQAEKGEFNKVLDLCKKPGFGPELLLMTKDSETVLHQSVVAEGAGTELLEYYKAQQEKRESDSDRKKRLPSLADLVDGNQYGLLSVAAQTGNQPMMSYLVNDGEVGINMNQGPRKRTVLHDALEFGLPFSTVDFLVKSLKANPTRRSDDGQRLQPLHLAATQDIPDTPKIIGFLCDAGADVNALDAARRTPLEVAQQHKNKAAEEILTARGGKIVEKQPPPAGGTSTTAGDGASQQRPSLIYPLDNAVRLASGSFGVVFKVNGLDGITIAVKVMPIKLPPGISDDQRRKEIDAMMMESRLMEQFEHQNVVGIKGTEMDDEDDPKEVRIYMQLMNRGSISNVISENSKFRLHEPLLRTYFLASLKGLKYLHNEKGIIHRDIKPANMLADGDGILKLSDFGSCKRLTKNNQGDGSAGEGFQGATFVFCAPELFLNSPPLFTEKTDIWALACSIICMATGAEDHPWRGIDELEREFNSAGNVDAVSIFKKFFSSSAAQKHPNIPSHLSKSLRTILERMLALDPSQRPTAAEVLRYDYFAQLNWRPKEAEDAVEDIKTYIMQRSASSQSSASMQSKFSGSSGREDFGKTSGGVLVDSYAPDPAQLASQPSSVIGSDTGNVGKYPGLAGIPVDAGTGNSVLSDVQVQSLTAGNTDDLDDLW